VTAKTHYRNKGFTMDPDTKKEYKDYIISVMNSLSSAGVPPELSQLARHYYYVFLNHIAYDMGFPWKKDIKNPMRILNWPLDNSSIFIKQLLTA